MASVRDNGVTNNDDITTTLQQKFYIFGGKSLVIMDPVCRLQLAQLLLQLDNQQNDRESDTNHWQARHQLLQGNGHRIEGGQHTLIYVNRGQLKKSAVWVQSCIQPHLFANSRGVCSHSWSIH